jgi:hypothetical protein
MEEEIEKLTEYFGRLSLQYSFEEVVEIIEKAQNIFETVYLEMNDKP